MKTLIKILLVSLVILSGCKTTRKVESTKTQSAEVLKNNIQSTADSSASIHVVTNRVDSLMHIDSLSIKETVVELSKPDSSGLQYPVKVTYREASHIKQTKSKAKATKDSTSTVNKSSSNNDHTVKQSQSSNDSKVKTKTVHHRWYWLVIMAIVGAAAFFILKRFGLWIKVIDAFKRGLKFIFK